MAMTEVRDKPSPTRRSNLVDRIVSSLTALNRAPLTDYHLILVVTGLLTVIGLGMVLSSSNVLAVSLGGTPFDIFLRQTMYVALGWVGFLLALRVRTGFVRRAGTPLMAVALVLLIAALIPGVAAEVNGSRGWINLGLFYIQPAEVAKFAFIIWACGVVAKRMRTGYWRDLLFPAIFGFLLVGGLIVAAPDLGMATATGLAFMAILWFAGYPSRHFAWLLGTVGVLFVVMAVTMPYRFSRLRTFTSTFTGDFSSSQGDGYQSFQGMLSLADGGLFGVGLGQSAAKWFYLPEATNDFIFAIIGEELGWFGAFAVVGIYFVLGWAGLRIAMRSVDPFTRLLAGTITVTNVLQAFINIGYVVGLLPVTGLQLPLISNGGSSAVITLTSLGLLANCARHEPEAISAILSSPSARRRRWYSLPAPRPYAPEPVLPKGKIPGRSSDGARRFGETVTRPSSRAVRPGEAAARPAYQTMPSPNDHGQRRGATPMTGRTARTVRGREQSVRDETVRRQTRERSDSPRDTRQSTPRPTSIHRGQRR